MERNRGRKIDVERGRKIDVERGRKIDVERGRGRKIQTHVERYIERHKRTTQIIKQRDCEEVRQSKRKRKIARKSFRMRVERKMEDRKFDFTIQTEK